MSTLRIAKSLPALSVAVLLAAGSGAAAQIESNPGDLTTENITQLRQRLDRYESELKQIHARLGQPGEAHFASLAAEADAPKDAAKNEETFTKVEVIDKPTIKVGGRIFADHLMITQSDLNKAAFGDLSDRSRFRQGRLEASGLVNEIVDYKAQFEFQDDVAFKDVYITVMQLPILGSLRVGHFKEPFSLEELTSARFIPFMERASAGIFTPGRRYGLMAFNDISENPDATWFLGGFRDAKDENSPDHISDDGYSLTGRVAWLPYYDEPTKGRYLVHLGAAASYRIPETDSISLSREPGLTISGATFNRTGTLTGVDNYGLGGLEFATAMGPLSIQSEWYVCTIDRGALGDGTLQSAYVYVSYFLTGENRGYNRAQKTFDRVTPYENFFRVRTADGVCCGRGAWEVAVRYSYVDLIDGSVNGSRCDDVTLGVNWYLNPYTRMMFNWVHGDVDNLQGAPVDGGFADLYGMRFQVDF